MRRRVLYCLILSGSLLLADGCTDLLRPRRSPASRAIPETTNKPEKPVPRPAPVVRPGPPKTHQGPLRCDAQDFFYSARQLREQLALIVRRYRRTRVGLVVVDDNGRRLFEHNANLSFNPASNIKLITAATALEALGAGYRFVTEVRGDADEEGRVRALYLRGSGDPSLQTEALEALAREVAAAGVIRVDGPLFVDTSAVKAPTDPPGYRSFVGGNPYRAGISALTLNDNVVRISVSPGAEPGTPAVITVFPASKYIVVRARARTTHWRTRLKVKSYRHGDRTGLIVRGTISQRRGRTQQFWRRVFHPARYAGHTFAELLRAEGVAVKPRLRVLPGRARKPAALLARHLSVPLHVALRQTLKHSSNVKAEQLLLAAGAARYGAPANYQKGRRAIGELLSRAGVERGTYRIENGSGLSRRTRLRPIAMVKVLSMIHRDFKHGTELLASLPLAGVDGTLRRRFGGAVVGSLRAKTGTLSGVTCLSGFAGRNDRILFFSLMVLRVSSYGAVLQTQRRIAGALVDYLDAASEPRVNPAGVGELFD